MRLAVSATTSTTAVVPASVRGSVVAKVAGDMRAVAPRLRQAIRAVDPEFPSDLVPMEEFVRDRLARSRFLVILMQIFGDDGHLVARTHTRALLRTGR